MTNTERVRIEIAKALAQFYHDYPENPLAGENAVNQILSIKELHVEAQDQNIPEKPMKEFGIKELFAYGFGQGQMQRGHWIKCEPKQEG